jgi:hypothetical protein
MSGDIDETIALLSTNCCAVPKPLSSGREEEQPKYGGIQSKPNVHLYLGNGMVRLPASP